MLWSADDVVGRLTFALQEQVSLADGVGFGVDLLAKKVHRDLLAAFFRQLQQGLLGHREHAAGAAGAIVKQVGAVLDLVGDRLKDEARHESHGVAWGSVLARLFVVLLVEAAHQLFKDGAHGMVVKAR